MTIKAESFIAIEKALTTRLAKSLKKATTELYKKVGTLISNEEFSEAERLINTLDLSPILEGDKDYIAYMTDLSMLFGASRVTPDPSTSVVGLGYEKTVAQQAVQSLNTLLVFSGGDSLKKTALQLIAQARNDAQVQVEKFNPYHDELGRFTTADKAVGGGEGDTYRLDGIGEGLDLRDAGSVRMAVNMFGATTSEEVLSGAGAYLKDTYEEYQSLDNEWTRSVDHSAKEPMKELLLNSSSLRALTLMDAWDGSGNFAEWLDTPQKLYRVGGVSATAEFVSFTRSKVRSTQGAGGTSNDTVDVITAAPKYWLGTGSGGAEVYIDPANLQRVTKKAERRILKPFASFMDEQGQAFIDIASSLHTSRVSAYGFTAEAYVMGYEEYQINEQLDSKICPVCEQMHGKTFKVSDARALLDIVLRVDNPEDLKNLQPWPKQDKASVEALKEMTTEELVANHWHVPPFHPKCRGLLGRKGKVPSVAQAATGLVEQPYHATREDFKALGVSMNTKGVNVWNTFSDISPLEVAARLQGVSLVELAARLLVSKKTPSSGILGMSYSKNLSMRMEWAGFGSVEKFYQNVQINPTMKTLYLNALEIAEVDQASGVMSKYMLELVSVTRDMGLSSITMSTGLEVGGFAWAKYGFVPTLTSWNALTKTLKAKLAEGTVIAGVPEETVSVIHKIVASNEPSNIFVLSDLVAKNSSGVPVGRALLSGTEWEGSLVLNNASAMERFLAYFGN